MKYTSRLSTLGTLLALTHSSSAVVLIDYTFGGTDIGPAVQQVSNGLGSGFSANTTTGVINTGAGGSNSPNFNNNTTGFNSSGLVDVSSAPGFCATFVISLANANLDVASLQSNGLFFGVVAGTDATATAGTSLFNNEPDSFGYIAGSGTHGDHGWFEGNGLADVHNTLASTAPSDVSFEDGFTLKITVMNDDTWTMSSTGLINDFSDSGSLGGTDANGTTTSSLTYANFNNLGIYTSLQGRNGGSDITIERMTLETIPEPSSTALLGLGGLALLLRRRK